MILLRQNLRISIPSLTPKTLNVQLLEPAPLYNFADSRLIVVVQNTAEVVIFGIQSRRHTNSETPLRKLASLG